MSFASEIKEELLRADLKRDCCRFAQCYGMLLFSRLFTLNRVSFNSNNGTIVRRLADEISTLAGIIVQVETFLHRKGGTYSVEIPDEADRKRLLECFGSTGEEINTRIVSEYLQKECCRRAFLRGAFLVCGTVSDPHKEYHLEFSVPFYKLSQDLVMVLSAVEELNLSPSVVNRKGAYVVYFKESEKIADFLIFIGAKKSSMNMMQVKMLKEVRNYVNRKTNFETANLEKTVSASVKQREAIERFVELNGFEGYPEELRETARLRYQNPDMSLRELSEKLGISRSGVNHRLKRIMALWPE